MSAVPPTSTVKLWHAPDVMDALMLRGRFVNHRYPPHAHDTHCVAVITGGALVVELPGERRVCRRGDVVVIDADVVHAGHAQDSGGWKMRVAHVQPGALATQCERLGLPARERFAPRSSFIRDRGLSQDLYGINWCSEVGADALKRGERMVCALTRLTTRHSRDPAPIAPVAAEPRLVRAVKRRLADDLGAKLPCRCSPTSSG